MALPVAQLPNLPGLNLGGGSTSREPKLRDVILARIASDVLGQVVGQTVGNVMTHATGGDMTQQAVDEGLMDEDKRNPIQRWLGNQTTEAEYRQMSQDKQATDQRNIENALKGEELLQRMDAQTAAQRQANEANLLQQDQINARREGDLAQLRQGNAEMRQRQALIDAQARNYGAEAEKTELGNEMSRDMMLRTKLSEILGSLPGADDPQRAAQWSGLLQEFAEEDKTPTIPEFNRWRTNRKPQTPTPTQNPSNKELAASSVTTSVGDIQVKKPFSIRPEVSPEVRNKQEVLRLYEQWAQAQPNATITRSGQLNEIQDFQEQINQASPEVQQMLKAMIETPEGRQEGEEAIKERIRMFMGGSGFRMIPGI